MEEEVNQTPPPVVADTVEPIPPVPGKSFVNKKTLEVIFVVLLLVAGALFWGYVLWGGEKGAVSSPPLSVPASVANIPATASPSAERPRQSNTQKSLFGYIKGMGEESGKKYIEVDEAEFLEGTAAVEAAMKETGCAREACAPNNFYVRNLDSAITRYFLSEGVVIRTLQGDGVTLGEGRPFQEFSRNFDPVLRDDPLINSGGDRSFQKEAPYDLTLIGDLVTSITQRYIP